MRTIEEIREEALKRFPPSKPMHYLDEGQRLGFNKGALWMKNLQETECEILEPAWKTESDRLTKKAEDELPFKN